VKPSRKARRDGATAALGVAASTLPVALIPEGHWWSVVQLPLLGLGFYFGLFYPIDGKRRSWPRFNVNLSVTPTERGIMLAWCEVAALLALIIWLPIGPVWNIARIVPVCCLVLALGRLYRATFWKDGNPL
jgi:hypothetical protein